MAAQLPDIAVTRNAGWSRSLVFYQDKARTLPTDFTGCTGKAQLRAGQGETFPLLAEIAVSFPEPRTSGRIKLNLSQAQLKAIDVSTGWFDVLVKPAEGEPVRLCYAKLMIGDGETVWA